MRQSKLEPPSVEVKEKLAPVAFVGSLGCAVMFVSGAVVSYVNVSDAGGDSTPARLSVARTRIV
jgi:hypothetical protein